MDGSKQAKAQAREKAREQVYGTVIVGTGFAGLGMAIKLKQSGERDFLVLEKAGEVGGTWRDNHYPGCACDVQSHLYSFSFEPNPGWSRMFSPQPEIWAYLRQCAAKHGLYPHIRFQAELSEARWDEEARLWRLKTGDGQRLAARVLVSGTGGLSRPAYPTGIKGLGTFAGKTFHSQDWDHGYDLRGKRVAVIGTGASAIQFVPQIQKQVARLDLYQRTPPWIVPKPDRPISDGERRLFRRLPLAQKLYRTAIYWMLEARVLGFAINPKLMKLIQRIALAHIHRQVKDPALRAKLTPDYVIGCKRVLISNDYYPALAQPNVEVVTDGIREVRAHGIVGADGVERKIDAIIFGTGFHAVDSAAAAPDLWPRRRGPDGRLEGRPRSLQGQYRGRLSQFVPDRRPQYRPGAQLDGLHDRVPGGLHHGRAAHHAAQAPGQRGSNAGSAGRLQPPAPGQAQPRGVERGRLQELVPARQRQERHPVARLHLAVPACLEPLRSGALYNGAGKPGARCRWGNCCRAGVTTSCPHSRREKTR